MLLTPQLKIIIVLLLFAAFSLGTGFGYKVTDNYWQAKWAKAELTAQTAQTKQLNTLIENHNTRVAELEKIDHDTQTDLDAAVTAGNNADDAGASLQQSISDNVRESGKTCDTSLTTRERAAAATNVLVLANVLRRADKRAGELAKITDQSRVRGLACEASYAAAIKNCR